MRLLYICVVIVTDLFFATSANVLNIDVSTSEVEPHDQQRFTKLLSSIVKLNERRLDAMKRLTRLEEADPAMESYFGDYADRRETVENTANINDDSNFLGFMVLQKKPALRTSNNQLTTTKATKTPQMKKKNNQSKNLKRKEPKVESTFTVLDNEIKKNDTECYIAAESKSILRKRWDKSCQKKASKVCKKACVEATKNACSYTSCSSKEKRNLKRECKTECKARFLND